MRRTCLGLICLVLCVTEAIAQTPPPTAALSDSEIHRILIDRIDTQKQGVGIVVGVIEPQGRRVIAYGSLEKGDKRPLDGDTLFEIGSITKVFTALLAAGPGGADIFRLKFEHGLIDWRIFLDADGKIATQFWHPVPE
jgi:D-alanyl-D-alanine-carboxypeptidase/D-alanyl-D-alanine-endopeptidase